MLSGWKFYILSGSCTGSTGEILQLMPYLVALEDGVLIHRVVVLDVLVPPHLNPVEQQELPR